MKNERLAFHDFVIFAHETQHVTVHAGQLSTMFIPN